MNRRTLSALVLVAVAATVAVGLQQASANTRAGVAGGAPVAPNTDPIPVPPSPYPTPIEPSPYPTPVEPSSDPTPIQPSPDGTIPTTLAPRPGTGLLTGHLYGVGGMAPGTRVAWSGTVTVTGKGVHQDVTVGQDGAFAVMLRPGLYAVTGRSPAHLGPVTCMASGKAAVAAGRTVTVDVVCPIP